MAWGRRKSNEEAPIDVAARLSPYDDRTLEAEPFAVEGLAAVQLADVTPVAPHSLLTELRALSDA